MAVNQGQGHVRQHQQGWQSHLAARLAWHEQQQQDYQHGDDYRPDATNGKTRVRQEI